MKRNFVIRITSFLSTCFLLLFLLAVLNRTGSLLLIWNEQQIDHITHDAGNGYYTYLPNENISRLGLPFFLKEDGTVLEPKPLSVNEDINVSIKELGGGRFQVLSNNDLYFSASDNKVEEHDYSIISPVIIRNRYLLVLFGAAILAAAADLFWWLKYREIKPVKAAVHTAAAVLFLLCLLPWDRMTFPALPGKIGPLPVKPIFQRNIPAVGLIFAVLWINSLLYRKNKFLFVLSILILLSNTVYYFVPEWNWFGQREDSSGYILPYNASSIRTPGYPKFIEAVYKLTGNNGLEKLRASDEGPSFETIQNGTVTESRGLLAVVRAQKIVLAAVFLIFFGVFCRFYPAFWFAAVSQIILCGGFLGVDNSYIMTECLSQAAVLLAAAMLIPTLKEKRKCTFLILCIASALGILIRPANIFLVIPVLLGAVWLFIGKRGILVPLLGCFLFFAITAVPALTIYRAYRIFVWMPSSGYVEIARAVEIMQPGDEEAFKDPELREFCRDLLVKKEEYPDADQNTNMWQVGIAAALDRGYDLITCSPVFGKISRKIFMLHPKEFAAVLGSNIRTALERTRLQLPPIPFAAFAILFTVLFVLRITTDSFMGMFFMGLHVIHLCISMMNQPERRYIYSTEILCLLGWLLILISLIPGRKTAENLFRRRRS